MLLKGIVVLLSTAVVSTIPKADMVHCKMCVWVIRVFVYCIDDLVSVRIVVCNLTGNVRNLVGSHMFLGGEIQDIVPEFSPIGFTKSFCNGLHLVCDVVNVDVSTSDEAIGNFFCV